MVLCGGIIPQLVVMYGLGFNIGIVYSVEWDSVDRKVTEALRVCVNILSHIPWRVSIGVHLIGTESLLSLEVLHAHHGQRGLAVQWVSVIQIVRCS